MKANVPKRKVFQDALDLLTEDPVKDTPVAVNGVVDKVEKYLNVIRERTNVMRSLTEELFRYSLMALQEEELHIEQVCINDILEQSLVGFYGVFMKKDITPDIQMPEIKIIRYLDKMAVRRVFDNILSNAARYADGNFTVKLTAEGKILFSNHAR